MMDPDHEIEHWSEFDRGGDFHSGEVPDLLVGDVREFFRGSGDTRAAPPLITDSQGSVWGLSDC